MAIGARSQSAKTYLEKSFESFENGNNFLKRIFLTKLASLDELIKHGLTALSETIQSSSEGLNNKNCSVAVVGLNQPFNLLEGALLNPYLSALEKTGGSTEESSTSKMEE